MFLERAVHFLYRFFYFLLFFLFLFFLLLLLLFPFLPDLILLSFRTLSFFLSLYLPLLLLFQFLFLFSLFLLLLFQFLFLFSLFLLLLFSISFTLTFSSFFSFPPPFFSLEVFFFFFFEGIACTVCFRDVRNDTTDCNQLYIYCNKEIFYFSNLEFMHSDVCNLLVYSLTVTYDQIINKHTVRHPKTDNTLFKITTRGLLIKTLKVLSIPSVR